MSFPIRGIFTELSVVRPFIIFFKILESMTPLAILCGDCEAARIRLGLFPLVTFRIFYCIYS